MGNHFWDVDLLFTSYDNVTSSNQDLPSTTFQNLARVIVLSLIKPGTEISTIFKLDFTNTDYVLYTYDKIHHIIQVVYLLWLLLVFHCNFTKYLFIFMYDIVFRL